MLSVACVWESHPANMIRVPEIDKLLSALRATHSSVHDDIKVKSTVSRSNKPGNQWSKEGSVLMYLLTRAYKSLWGLSVRQGCWTEPVASVLFGLLDMSSKYSNKLAWDEQKCIFIWIAYCSFNSLLLHLLVYEQYYMSICLPWLIVVLFQSN